MKTRKWIRPVVTQEGIDPAESAVDITRINAPGRATRSILILALVLGGLGAEGAVTSGHGTGDKESAHNTAGDNRPAASAYLTSSVRAKPDAFMW